MIGRGRRKHEPLWRSIEVQTESGTRFSIGEIQLYCPKCRSPLVGGFGTHGRKNKRVETFQCKDSYCAHLKKHKTPKQFVLTTSHQFQEFITDKLQNFYGDLMIDGVKQNTFTSLSHGIKNKNLEAMCTSTLLIVSNISGNNYLIKYKVTDLLFNTFTTVFVIF